MKDQSVFRIESRRFENYMQFFKIGAIISAIVVTMYLILKLAVFDGQVEYINLAGYAFAFSMYYEYKRRLRPGVVNSLKQQEVYLVLKLVRTNKLPSDSTL